MTSRIPLDDITPEQFNQLVGLVSHWVARGEVSFRFWLPSGVAFDFDEDSISRQLISHQLPDSCMSQLKHDIPVMIGAILTGHRNSVVRFLANHSELPESEEASQTTREQIRGEVLARIKSVEEKIVTAELRQRFAIKSSAKTSVYTDVTWEVVRKQSVSDGTTPSNLTYATIRIVGQKPSTIWAEPQAYLPLPLLIGTSPSSDVDTIALTMSLEDILELKDSLEKASKALMEVMQGEGE